MGFKLSTFKYILQPLFIISVIKIVLFYFMAQGITNIVLDYTNYIYFNDQSLQQLTVEGCTQVETIYNRHYTIAYQLKEMAEQTAISNKQYNPMEEANKIDSTKPILYTYTQNVIAVDNGGSILGYSSTTGQSVQSFNWYVNKVGNIQTISQLDTQETYQLTNNFLRIFEVVRPIYKGYQTYISDIIISSESTKMYMRFPAKKSNQFSSGGYDFTQTIYYQNVKSNYVNNNKDLTYLSFSSKNEPQYMCIVIEISVGCQNAFCGVACILFKSSFSEFSNWVSSTLTIYQNLDNIFILLRGNSIVYTSTALSDSTSSQLLPLSTDLVNIAQNYNLMRGNLLINQTTDSWIACNSIDLQYQSTQLGYLSMCSISSKYQMKVQMSKQSNKTFTFIYEYPIYIYLFNLFCAYIIIYYTSINFITPLKDLKNKILLISEENLQLVIPTKKQNSIKEIKDMYEALSFLYDSLTYSLDEFYENEEDSLILIRLCSALKHFEKLKNQRGIGIVSNNIGLIHIQNQRYKEAIKSFKQSLKIVEDKMRSIIKGYPLEQFYDVKPEKGWKYFFDENIQEENEEKKELLIDLENIPDKVMKSDTVESFFKKIVNQEGKEKAKQKKKKETQAERNSQNQNDPASSNLKFDKHQTVGKGSNQWNNFEIFNGIPSNNYVTPKKLGQLFSSSNSKTKNNNDKSVFSIKHNTPNLKMKFTKSQMTRLQKLEPLYIDRCNQLANAYCIYAFDIKKTNRKQAKRLAEKAIEKYKIVSRLLKNYEHIPNTYKKHFMVIIRLIQLYLECADYNKFVVKTKDSGEAEFKKSYDAYNQASEMLKQYESQRGELKGDQSKEEILNQIHHFYIFLYLKGVGLYLDAYDYFIFSICKYKYYDPAIRYSFLIHVKQILERFNPKIPKSLNDMIEGFKVRKNKDIVFVLNFCKPVELRWKRKLQFENVREKMAQVFMKIYEKYIEGDDRVAFVQVQKQIDVIFELKEKHNNEKYFKNCIIRNTTISDTTPTPFENKDEKGTQINLEVKRETSKQIIELSNLRDSTRNDQASEQPTFRKFCRSIYTARKLFEKVEARKNLKWIVVITDNLDNTVENTDTKLKYYKQLQEYLDYQVSIQKNENEEQPDLIHLMIIGLNLQRNTKELFKNLCQVTQEGIFIENCNSEDIDIAFESISNISHLYGQAAGSTGVSIQDFQNESFSERKISDEEFNDFDDKTV